MLRYPIVLQCYYEYGGKFKNILSKIRKKSLEETISLQGNGGKYFLFGENLPLLQLISGSTFRPITAQCLIRFFQWQPIRGQEIRLKETTPFSAEAKTKGRGNIWRNSQHFTVTNTRKESFRIEKIFNCSLKNIFMSSQVNVPVCLRFFCFLWKVISSKLLDFYGEKECY